MQPAARGQAQSTRSSPVGGRRRRLAGGQTAAARAGGTGEATARHDASGGSHGVRPAAECGRPAAGAVRRLGAAASRRRDDAPQLRERASENGSLDRLRTDL
jgi:hypothetical protein